MTNILVTTFLWLAIVASFPLYSQRQRENILGDLWSKVEENYPGVGVKMSAIDAAKLNEQTVKSNMLPQIKAQARRFSVIFLQKTI